MQNIAFISSLLISLVLGQSATISNLRTRQISTPFTQPVAVEFYFPSNHLIITSYYPNGIPSNFRKVDSTGAQAQWSSVSGETDEIKMALVRDGNTAGFTPGDLFTGNGLDGQVQRVTQAGNTVYPGWCILNQKGFAGSFGLMRGGLHVDLWNEGWGHNLVICTHRGHMFEITVGDATCGTVTRLGGASAGTHLEGLHTIKNDARYGLIAGAVVFGAEGQGRLYYVRSSAKTVLQWAQVGCNIEDIDVVLPNQNYFIVNYGSGRLLGIDYTQWANHIDKIVLVSEYDGRLLELLTSNNTLQCAPITIDPATPQGDRPSGNYEQAVFAPAGVAEVLPADFSLCIAVSMSGSRLTTSLEDYNTIKYTLTNTALTNYRLASGVGNPIVPTGMADDTLYVWFGQDYRNEFTLNIFVNPSLAGSVTLNFASSNLGSTVYTILQNNPTDSYYFVPSSGTGRFTWTWTAGTATAGVILGPLSILDATQFFTASITIESFVGVHFVQVLGTNSSGRAAPQKGWPSSPTFLTANMQILFERKSCTCGNGRLDKFEQCDNGAQNGQTGQCCTSECAFMTPAVQCRDAITNDPSLPCDAPDFCTGSSGVCPDRFIVDGRQCNATTDNGGQCAYCPGTAASCGSFTPTCPSCDSLNNCSGHGVCDTTGGTTRCICFTDPGQPLYTGPLCNIPVCAPLNNCSACNTHPECGWCCKESTCVPKANNRPDPRYLGNSTCDLAFWRATPERCACSGANTCQNGGTCSACGDCQCIPPFGGSTCSLRIDCFGVLGGTAVNGICGCNQGNTSCIGCDGVPFGKQYDVCGVCGGDGTSCYELCPWTTCEDCATTEQCAWCIGDDANPCKNVGVDDTSMCQALRTDIGECGLQLSESEIVGLTTGIVALIVIIVIIVVAALAAGGSYATYKYWSQYRGKFGGASSNPLYEGKESTRDNPFYEERPSSS